MARWPHSHGVCGKGGSGDVVRMRGGAVIGVGMLGWWGCGAELAWLLGWLGWGWNGEVGRRVSGIVRLAWMPLLLDRGGGRCWLRG